MFGKASVGFLAERKPIIATIVLIISRADIGRLTNATLSETALHLGELYQACKCEQKGEAFASPFFIRRLLCW